MAAKSKIQLELEAEIKKLKRQVAELEEEKNELEEEVEELEVDAKNASSAIETLLKQSIHINFEKPMEAGANIFIMLKKTTVSNRIEFTKQLVANVYGDLKKQLEAQRNSLAFNEKMMDKLQCICGDVEKETVAFEPRG